MTERLFVVKVADDGSMEAVELSGWTLVREGSVTGMDRFTAQGYVAAAGWQPAQGSMVIQAALSI